MIEWLQKPNLSLLRLKQFVKYPLQLTLEGKVLQIFIGIMSDTN